jgi:hypothetical protein
MLSGMGVGGTAQLPFTQVKPEAQLACALLGAQGSP